MPMDGWKERAAEVARLAEKATPGPWLLHRRAGKGYIVINPSLKPRRPTHYCVAYTSTRDSGQHDGAFIAHAPQMARLIAEMAERVQELEQRCNYYASIINAEQEAQFRTMKR